MVQKKSASLAAAVTLATTLLLGRASAQPVEPSWDDPKPLVECSTDGWYAARSARFRPTAAPGSVFADAEETRRQKGTLNRDALQGTVRAHLPEVKFCFQRELQQDANLSGRVFIRFTVAANGAVTAADVESSTVESAAVEGCLAAAVRRWTFPHPSGDGPATTSYPFTFH